MPVAIVRSRVVWRSALCVSAAALVVASVCSPPSHAQEPQVGDTVRRLQCTRAPVGDLSWTLTALIDGPGGLTCQVKAACKAMAGGRLRVDVLGREASDAAFAVLPPAGSVMILNAGRGWVRSGAGGETRSFEPSTEPPPVGWTQQALEGSTDFGCLLPCLQELSRTIAPGACAPASDPPASADATAVELRLTRPTKIMEGVVADAMRFTLDAPGGLPTKRELLNGGRLVGETAYSDVASSESMGSVFGRAVTSLPCDELPVEVVRGAQTTTSTVLVGGIGIETTYRWFPEPGVLLPVRREAHTGSGDVRVSAEMSDYAINDGLEEFWFYIPAADETTGTGKPNTPTAAP